MSALATAPDNDFGTLLRTWRVQPAHEPARAGVGRRVSSRHLSFIETGRSRPSREMVVHLAEQLDVPLRERNALLTAAGFAPLYRETPLSAPEMEQARAAIELVLRQPPLSGARGRPAVGPRERQRAGPRARRRRRSGAARSTAERVPR